MDFTNAMLFSGLSAGEIFAGCRALHAIEKEYEKDEIILRAGDVTRKIGLVVRGGVTIESNDMWGNRTVLSHVGEGGFFAESYAILGETLLVDARASERCRVMFLDLGPLAEQKEDWARKLTGNLLKISARKNLALSGRSFHTAPKSVRERVLAYLNSEALKTQSGEFDIPFDRQALADYLSVDRSALSKELARMKKDGLIEYRKNHFKIGLDA